MSDRHPAAGKVSRVIGGRLRLGREQAGLSPQDLADQLGLRVDELARIERGDQHLTAENIVELCPMLKVMPSWFFEGLV